MAVSPQQPPDPDSDDDAIDDDLMDDALPSDPNRMTLGMRVFFVVLMLAVAGMITYLVLNILYPEQFAKPSWIGAKSTKESGSGGGGAAMPKGFQVGGIAMGMTPAEAKAVYPDIRFEPAPGGGTTGVFRHHDGEYRVTFHAPDHRERAYRISSRHVYPKVSYVDLLSQMSGKYGRPEATSCGAEEGTIAIRCALQWTLVDAALDAQIRTAAPAGGADATKDAVTTLTVTAVDLRPDVMFQKPAVPPAK